MESTMAVVATHVADLPIKRKQSQVKQAKSKAPGQPSFLKLITGSVRKVEAICHDVCPNYVVKVRLQKQNAHREARLASFGADVLPFWTRVHSVQGPLRRIRKNFVWAKTRWWGLAEDVYAEGTTLPVKKSAVRAYYEALELERANAAIENGVLPENMETVKFNFVDFLMLAKD